MNDRLNADYRSKLDNAVFNLLIDSPEGISLYELIKQLSQPPIQLFDERPLSEPKGLFETNFVVMNTLYRLKNTKFEYHFEISSLKIYCTVKSINNAAQEAKQSHPETLDPLAEYYLNWNNFQQTEDDINDLLNSFWERMLVLDFEEEDLTTLGLEKPVTLAEIKTRYRKLSQHHHPDKGGDAEIFIAIKTAYQRLIQR